MRVNVIVPAAGRSRRMGVPKLLISWHGRRVIEHVLETVCGHSGVLRVGVLCRPDDYDLRRVVGSYAGVDVIVPPGDTGEMRVSVEWIVKGLQSTEPVGWMLIPADHPVIEAEVLDRLIQAWGQQPEKIAVPVHAGRRGHPTIFPASFPEDVKRIPAGQGINWLLRSAPPEAIQEVQCPEPSVLFDLDTPEDLARLQQQFKTDAGRQESGGQRT